MDGTRQRIGCQKPLRISRPHRKIRRFEMDGQRGFAKFSLLVGGSIEAHTVAERLSFTPNFEDVGTTARKPKKAAEASAEAAYPLGHRNAVEAYGLAEPTALCSRRMKVS